MMYHPEMRSATQAVTTYDSREQAIAVRYGRYVSPTIQIRMQVDKKYFVFEVGEGNPALQELTLEFIILSGCERDLVLKAMDCNIEGIDSLKDGETITACLINPESRLSIGGGWTIDEVLNSMGMPIYLSPGSRGFRDLS